MTQPKPAATNGLCIETLIVGPLQENCHIVALEGGTSAVVFDPGDEAPRIAALAARRGWKVEAIVLTHGHIDHVGGVSELKRLTAAPVIAPADEIEFMNDPEMNGASWIGLPFEPFEVERPIRADDPLTLLGLPWRVLYTPGHSPGSLSYYLATSEIAISGDVLFRDGVGRTDLPGGDWDELASSLRDVLFKLPDTTRIYSGHGPVTTLRRERTANPYVVEALEAGK